MRPVLLAAAAAFALTTATAASSAQEADPRLPPLTTEPAPATKGTFTLGTGDVPGAQVPESWFRIAGGPLGVRNVREATLTPFLPDPAKATGAAVVVAPGGGFFMLSMDQEGWPVARWLADHGIAAFVLKYRTQQTPADALGLYRALGSIMSRPPLGPNDDLASSTPAPAIEDGMAALNAVRAGAKKWGIDPARVGMMGFSAGAMTTLQVALRASPDKGPSFIAPIYPPMARVTVGASAPPMFTAIASNDPLFGKMGYGLAQSWQDAGRPFELHVYEKGGHGFGLGKDGTTSTDWGDSFLHWLRLGGFLRGRP